MSWSIKVTGPRRAVFAAVEAVQTMPLGIKNAIGEILLGLDDKDYLQPTLNPSPKHDSARVEGFGHAGGDNWSGIGKLEVELFTAAKMPEPAPANPAS